MGRRVWTLTTILLQHYVMSWQVAGRLCVFLINPFKPGDLYDKCRMTCHTFEKTFEWSNNKLLVANLANTENLLVPNLANTKTFKMLKNPETLCTHVLEYSARAIQ